MGYSLWGHKQSDTTEHNFNKKFTLEPSEILLSLVYTWEADLTSILPKITRGDVYFKAKAGHFPKFKEEEDLMSRPLSTLSC